MKEIKTKLILLVVAEIFLATTIPPAPFPTGPAWAGPADSLRPPTALSTREIVDAVEHREARDGGEGLWREKLVAALQLVRLAMFGDIPTEQIPREQRTVMILHYWEGLDNAEVARQTGKRPGDVRMLQHHARNYLIRLLEDELNIPNAKEAVFMILETYRLAATFGKETRWLEAVQRWVEKKEDAPKPLYFNLEGSGNGSRYKKLFEEGLKIPYEAVSRKLKQGWLVAKWNPQKGYLMHLETQSGRRVGRYFLANLKRKWRLPLPEGHEDLEFLEGVRGRNREFIRLLVGDGVVDLDEALAAREVSGQHIDLLGQVFGQTAVPSAYHGKYLYPDVDGGDLVAGNRRATLYHRDMQTSVMELRIGRLKNKLPEAETDWAGPYANLLDSGKKGKGARIKTARDLLDSLRGKRLRRPELGFIPLHRDINREGLSGAWFNFGLYFHLRRTDLGKNPRWTKIEVRSFLLPTGEELVGFWPPTPNAKQNPPLRAMKLDRRKDDWVQVGISSLRLPFRVVQDGGGKRAGFSATAALLAAATLFPNHAAATQAPPEETTVQQGSAVEELFAGLDPAKVADWNAKIKELTPTLIRGNEAALLEFSRIRDTEAIPALMGALRNPRHDVWWIAAVVLGKIDHPTAKGALHSALEDSDGSVRLHAAWAQYNSKEGVTEEAIKVLMEIASDRNNPTEARVEARIDAIRLLGKVGVDRPDIRTFLEALKDDKTADTIGKTDDGFPIKVKVAEEAKKALKAIAQAERSARDGGGYDRILAKLKELVKEEEIIFGGGDEKVYHEVLGITAQQAVVLIALPLQISDGDILSSLAAVGADAANERKITLAVTGIGMLELMNLVQEARGKADDFVNDGGLRNIKIPEARPQKAPIRDLAPLYP